MALDGIMLSLLVRELAPLCGIARVDKVQQPVKETLVLTLRQSGGARRLLLSASSQTPRLHLCEVAIENPAAPPMFCMLLRKHLLGAKLLEIQQPGAERIVRFLFQGKNELGDSVIVTLVVEIMGRHSNILLLDESGRIIDSIKRVSPIQSSVRQVLPGLLYTEPPGQDKINLLVSTKEDVAQRVLEERELPLERALMGNIEGISPIIAREIASYTAGDCLLPVRELTEDQRDRLLFFLGQIKDKLFAKSLSPDGLSTDKLALGGTPTMLCDTDGTPKDISFLPLTHYARLALTKEFPTYSALLEAFFRERGKNERIRQQSGDLFRHLANHAGRLERKLQILQEELEESKNRDQLRLLGDLLNANLYRLKKGETKAVLEDFYQESCPTVEIPLDARLSPAENAQRYYASYRRADTAERILTEQLATAKSDYAYIDSVLDLLLRAESADELSALREELAENGYLRREPRKKGGKQAALPPLSYHSSDGLLILQGRTNLQNDRLTMREAKKDDYWFHTQNIPGSHVILVTQGQEPSPKSLEEAAVIAASGSKARHSALVPVDYTRVRNVRKPNGARPGFVLYVNYQTATVTPDEALLLKLRVKK